MSEESLWVKDRIRLAEFSLLMAVLGVDPADYYYLSREPQPGFRSDIEAIRRERAQSSAQEEEIITVFLPSFKNYFPEAFVTERLEESDYHPGEFDDRNLRFWSAFDTVTYRFWISFHILKLRLLLYIPDVDTELLYWSRFGGEAPSLGVEERRYLLLMRFFAPFFRGRRLLYERLLPAFLKKQVTVKENVPRRQQVPPEYRSELGKKNVTIGRNFYSGRDFVENHSSFHLQIEDLEEDDISAFRPGGSRRVLLENLFDLFIPAHLHASAGYRFRSGLRLFVPGQSKDICYLGFTTYLRETA